MRRAALAVAALAVALLGCKKKGPNALRVWVGAEQGCITSKGNDRIGTFGCWGTNDRRQLGDGTQTSRAEVRRQEPIDGMVPTAMTFGERHGCALLPDQSARCWGDNEQQQLGPGAPPEGSAKPITVLPAIRLVSAGAHHTCFAGAERGLRCYGAAGEGQLATVEDDRVTALATGEGHTCFAVVSDVRSEVRCVGRMAAAPREPLFSGRAPTAIVAGAEHTCAVFEDTTVRCWGRNDQGQLGDGTRTDSLVPVLVAGIRDVVQLAAGARFTCARVKSGSVGCWGKNEHHQLANGTTEASSQPVGLRSLLGVEDLAAAGDIACVRLNDGFVRCWGRNDRGQQGDGSAVEHDVPMPILLR